jgi:hypothetical protein
MAARLESGLAWLATGTGVPAWRNVVLVVFFVAAAISIVIGLGLQVWVAALQLRRFARIFAGRPEAAEAFTRVFQTYGWRARLACQLFGISVPTAVQDTKS